MRSRVGSILVAVLVIIALATLAAASLLYRAHAEVAAAVAGSRRQQAYAVAMAGINRAMAVAAGLGADRESWYDNTDLFKNQFVCNDGANDWYYTIYAYNPSDPDVLRNGLSDEASKINVNVAGEETLLRLADMTPELVDALLDYIDRDGDTRPQGAEQDYYDQLPRPYMIKNGPLATVEELLLVKGFTGRIVYGEDYNLNGLLEDNEDDGETSFPPDDGDGVLDRGLLGLVTVWSYEMDLDREGNRRVNLNTAGDGELGRIVPAQTRQFIEIYRGEGNKFDSPAQLLEMRYRIKKDYKDLRLKAGDWIESGVGGRQLPDVMDRLTTRAGVFLGPVNVNTAPAEVLAALPGFDEELAERIVGARETVDPAAMETVAWLYTENIVSADTFKRIAPALTARSWQFHVRCVAYGWPCGQFRVIEAVVDTARGSPRIVYQRDLTRLGLPFPLSAQQEEYAQ
ncbi:MAG: general secretion pathway protein GspK [Planctomycetes bacterium]|nr:general secretion pathway protein GspK [Planctomycetota bacterium]